MESAKITITDLCDDTVELIKSYEKLRDECGELSMVNDGLLKEKIQLSERIELLTEQNNDLIKDNKYLYDKFDKLVSAFRKREKIRQQASNNAREIRNLLK